LPKNLLSGNSMTNVATPDKKFERLETAVTIARRSLNVHRQTRNKRLAAWLGTHYSDRGAERRTPINLLQMASGIYLRQLAGGNPRVMVNTEVQALQPAADDLRLAGDVLLNQINFIDTIRRVVMEGFFGAGIIKTGINASKSVEIGGYLHDVGQPFADPVSLDNFVFDVTAKRWEQVTFAGDYYRVPLSQVKESDLPGGKKKVIKELQPNEKRYIIEEGGDESTEVLGGFESAAQEEYIDHVELLDLWLPIENMFITVAVGGNSWKVIREIEWEGPEGGPYDMLSLQEVPDNILPMPPAAAWEDMHNLCNSILNKLGDQADRMKNVAVFPRGAEGDADAITNTPDGGVVEMDSPNSAKEMRWGGPDQMLMAMFIQVKDIFSWSAGNLDTLGGLSPMADTLGQESILDSNSSKMIDDMRDRTVGFTQKVVKKLLWWMWTDPLISLPITKRVEGTNATISSSFDASSREGDLLDYSIEINPYSFRYRTPAGQLQKLRTITQEMILPLYPLMEAKGITFKLDEYFKKVADYSDLPELADLIEYMDPAMEQENQKQPVSEGSDKPAITSRTNTRISQSTGGTRTGRDTAMFQQLVGGSPQTSANPNKG